MTVLVGGGITGFSLLMIQRNLKLKKEGTTAEGTIIQIDYEGISSPAYYLTVRFWTPQQEWMTVRSRYGIKYSRFREGQTVKVRFDPVDATNFTIEGEGSGITAWLSVLTGIVVVLYGIIHYLRA
nr:DUF3592 domain-containing protein [Hymenobacter citatus]